MLYLLLFSLFFRESLAADFGTADMEKALAESTSGPQVSSASEPSSKARSAANQSTEQSAVRLNYEVHGKSSSPTLVLIHGLGADLHVFDSVIQALAERFQVIAYDQRGHGKSQVEGFDYSLKTTAKDLKELLSQLGVEKAHILGHSFGGRTAIQFAALYPEFVQTLVIEDMDTVPRKNTKKLSDVLKDAKKLAALPRTFATREKLRKALAPLVGNRVADEAMNGAQEVGGEILLPAEFVSYHAELLYGFHSSRADMAPDLAQVTAPTLFVRGGRGCGMGKTGITLLKEQFPQVKLEVVPEGDHIIHHSRPREFLQVVVPFLEGQK